jgi:hypothetical protein
VPQLPIPSNGASRPKSLVTDRKLFISKPSVNEGLNLVSNHSLAISIIILIITKSPVLTDTSP